MKKLIGLGVVLIGALVGAFYFLGAQSEKFLGVMVVNSDVFDRVIVIPDETAPQVQTYLIFPHGEMHNPYAVGMAHYVEHLAYDVVQAGAACAPMLTYRRPLYLNEAKNDVTFTVSLARKDMQVMTDMTRNLGVATPQADITLDQLKLAETAGYGARDMAAMLAFAKENSK